MTTSERLSLPIAERIRIYEREFIWGPDDADDESEAPRWKLGRHEPKDTYEYVLYRLKLEDFERAELTLSEAAK